MDYTFLRQEGMRHLERMAGQLWTDFNVHDPGITILEQVCYAITDLGYRIAYDLPDLLAGDGVEPSRSLFSPAQILSGAADLVTSIPQATPVTVAEAVSVSAGLFPRALPDAVMVLVWLALSALVSVNDTD